MSKSAIVFYLIVWTLVALIVGAQIGNHHGRELQKIEDCK